VAPDSGVQVGTDAMNGPYMGYVATGLYDTDDVFAGSGVPSETVPTTELPVQPSTLGGFTLSTFDHSITVPNVMGVMTVPVETDFAFTVPIGSFQFAPGSVVVVHATQANGDPLPAWVTFDPSTGKFEGDASEFNNAHLHIVITARDQNGREVMLPVEIKFTEPTANERTPPTSPDAVPRFSALSHRVQRHHGGSPTGKASLAAQFARHGTHARQHELSALMGRV
jgi:hypothetical protein